MAPLLDGLLDAEIDLHLLSLALRDEQTHAVIVQRSLVRPSTRMTAISESENSYLQTPETQSAGVSRRNGAKRWLYVPLIRTPWADTLARLVEEQHHICLAFCDTPSTLDMSYLVRVLHRHSCFPNTVKRSQATSRSVAPDSKIGDDMEWNQAVSTFYGPLPACARRHNAPILQSLRAESPYGLERIATCARLAYMNMVATSFSQRMQQVSNTLNKSVAYQSPYSSTLKTLHKETTEKQKQHTSSNESNLRVLRVARCLVTAHDIPKQGGGPSDLVLLHGVVVHKRNLAALRSVLRMRYGIAVVGASNTMMTGMSDIKRREDTSYEESECVCLQNNEKTKGIISTTTFSGSLCSLSNRGTALLHCHNYSTKCYHAYSCSEKTRPCSSSRVLYPHPRPSRLLRHASSPQRTHRTRLSHLDVRTQTESVLKMGGRYIKSVDAYVGEYFGMTWASVIARATHEASAAISSLKKERLDTIGTELSSAHISTLAARDKLIQRAITLEMTGAPLSRIAAFTILQEKTYSTTTNNPGEQVANDTDDEALRNDGCENNKCDQEQSGDVHGLDDECTKEVQSAVDRIAILRTPNIRNASILLGCKL